MSGVQLALRVAEGDADTLDKTADSVCCAPAGAAGGNAQTTATSCC